MNRTVIAAMVALALSFTVVAADPPAAAPGPAVTISLKDRHGHATPARRGFSHIGGGNIDVAQPSPDTIVITLTGVAVAGAHPCKDSSASMTFDLDQCLEVSIDNPKIKRGKLTIEGRVIGLLRSHKGGGKAEQGPAHAGISAGSVETVGLDLPSHCVTGGENLSINDRAGPVSVPVLAGEYHLHSCVALSASHPSTLRMCKAASSEFAPDPALDPLWISYWEPFHGAAKKDFGFQITIKVAPE
jgi:hypothetical protein